MSRGYLEYAGYRFLVWIVPLLSRGGVVWLGRRLGGLFFLLSPRARRTGVENLRRVFPERDDHRRILRDALRLQGVALLDALWSTRLTPDRAERYVEMPWKEVRALERDLQLKNGVVVATAHFGSWEMFNLAAGAMGLPRATVIARPVRNPLIDRHLKRLRERTGNRLVYRDEALPACLGALRRGEAVCSVIDMAILPAEGGIFVDFCGTPALTSGALALLAVRRKVPLVFWTCRPLEGGRRYTMDVERIEVREADDTRAEVARVTLELNRALERMVRAHPRGWIWNYKRWKWRPMEQPGDYPSYSRWVGKLL